jgi:hypothetical protein
MNETADDADDTDFDPPSGCCALLSVRILVQREDFGARNSFRFKVKSFRPADFVSSVRLDRGLRRTKIRAPLFAASPRCVLAVKDSAIQVGGRRP